MSEVIVIGAGMVGVSTALHLRLRGHEVMLIDRAAPGEGTSFGNAGIIQREAVIPYAFPRGAGEVLRAALRRGVDISYHRSALVANAGVLLRYWWNSAPARHRRISRAYASLITHCLIEHAPLIELAGAQELIRRDGWLEAYRSESQLAASAAVAQAIGRDNGVASAVIDGAELARREPHLREQLAGAVHWRDPWTVRDPSGLVKAYAHAFEAAGGTLLRGEAEKLEPRAPGWRLRLDGRLAEAEQVVLATGPWTGPLSRDLGYRLPLFVKRGYHMHYAPDPERPLMNWIADLETGYVLAPMRAGIRLTTGAELAHQHAAPTPVQLGRAEAIARRLFPLGDRLDPAPWLGSRPCTADMLPVIGPAPRHKGLWFNFGHGHQGLTLGPASGRLLAEMLDGETPYVDPVPFAADRF